eukprot:257430_1
MASAYKDSLQTVKVFESLDKLSDTQKQRFLVFLSDSIGNTCSETGQVNAEILKSWGTQRIFLLENSSEAVIGSGLLLKPDSIEDCMMISGLCYDQTVVLSGQLIFKSIVSTWKSDFSNVDLSVDISKGTDFIKHVAQELGFVYDREGSNETWSRFVLSKVTQVKMDPDVRSVEVSTDLDNVQEHQPPMNPFYKCELCQKKFVMKYNLRKHRRTTHAKEMFWCDFCEKCFKRKSG